MIDQDKDFLRFIEHHNLKPGEAILVEERDAAADSVRVRGSNDRPADDRDASRVQAARASRSRSAPRSAVVARFAQATQKPAPPPRTALSGYMDFHFNNPEFSDAQLDFHRFVLLVTHTFSERIRFVGELELEHAVVEGLEEEGELELEQAYVDFLLSRSFNVRAGMMLMPIGIINERHEPPVYYGVERPFNDTVIIPTTWFEAGAGVHGEIGRGWRYRAFVVAPLDAAEFTAEEGHSRGPPERREANVDGRGHGTPRVRRDSRSHTRRERMVGQVGFRSVRVFDVPVSLAEFDGRYSRGPLRTSRTVLAGLDRQRRRLERRPRHSCRRQSQHRARPARLLRRGRVSRDLERLIRRRRRLRPLRELRHAVPDAGGLRPLPEFDRDAWVIGATYWPDPDVAVKFDYSLVRNRSGRSSAEFIQRRSGMVVLMRYACIGAISVARRLPPSVRRAARRTAPATPGHRDRAERFSFNPSEIASSRHEEVEIRLTSDDTMHGFRIIGTDIDLEIPSAVAAWRPSRSRHRRPLHVRMLQVVRRRSRVHARRHRRPSEGPPMRGPMNSADASAYRVATALVVVRRRWLSGADPGEPGDPLAGSRR